MKSFEEAVFSMKHEDAKVKPISDEFDLDYLFIEDEKLMAHYDGVDHEVLMIHRDYLFTLWETL